MLSKVLLRALLLSITPKNVEMVTRLLIGLLGEFAKKTETNLDDKLYEIFKRFCLECDKPDHDA